VASLPWSYSLIRDPDGRSALLLVAFAALACGVGFLVLGRLQWPWLKHWWGTHHVHACAVIANRVIFSRQRGPKIAVLSILVHVLAVVIAWCVVQSIAAPVVFSQVFELVPPVMLITMLPISIAGWGVREATMGLAFGYAGLMANEGVNISLLFGAVSFIVGAFGGLVWIFSAEKAAKGAAPIVVPDAPE
jgi:glycosyltransferase 2 family protein